MTPEEKISKKKEYWKNWYAKNKEVVLAKQRVRSAKNYQEKKEEYKARSRRWRLENPEKMQELQKQYQEKNKEKIRKRSKEWYLNNRERASANTRKQKLASFGMTQEDYVFMLKAQGGTCAICGKINPTQTKKRLHIDHDHATGEVRGLLCHHCNAGLGAFKDSVEYLRLAIAYLSST